MNALKAIWLGVKSFLGGYAWFAMIALMVVIGGLWLEFERRGDRITELSGQLEQAERRADRETNNQGALSGRDERRDQAHDERGQAYAKIDQTEDSANCYRSEPIGVTLGILSDRRARRQVDNPE